MAILNLGIVAHVDAGKTSLTERLLFNAGVIDSIGGVDTGDTQTDTDELERSRGITIRSAVVAFDLDGLHVNLIDTPTFRLHRRGGAISGRARRCDPRGLGC